LRRERERDDKMQEMGKDKGYINKESGRFHKSLPREILNLLMEICLYVNFGNVFSLVYVFYYFLINVQTLYGTSNNNIIIYLSIVLTHLVKIFKLLTSIRSLNLDSYVCVCVSIFNRYCHFCLSIKKIIIYFMKTS